MHPVIWRDAALDRLADAFVTADRERRLVLEQVVERLNRQLSADPLAVGESREGTRRVVLDKPVALDFRVEISGIVRVIQFQTF